MKFKNIIRVFIIIVFSQINVFGQKDTMKHSIIFTNGISSANIPGRPYQNFQNYFPFFTNQIGYVLQKDLRTDYAIQFGVCPMIVRYVFENQLFIKTRSFRSNYYISFPVSLQKKLSQKTEYWNIRGGLSLDLFLGMHDNYFYYDNSGYLEDNDGNLVYTEILLRGKDAKTYNKTIFNKQNPISVSCQASLVKHHELNSGSAIELGFNIQFMEIVSFYNDNLFFTGNATLLNFNFAIAYTFRKK
ncbi:MAG: hypothetical protein PHE33_04035 [Bacteroidales bacterium]|nr:hypothetical protein [Bacteroidales bacterium]